VILAPETAETALEAIRAGHRVLHTASQRVLVVQGDATDLRGLPGIHGAYADAVPKDVLEALTDAEALFARAWAARRATGAVEQRGEGLSWDAPGFSPPDVPGAAERD
jgi:hypothetical protein